MGCCPWKSIRPRGDEEEEEGRARGAGGVCRHLGKRKRLNEGWLWEGGQPVMLKRVTWAESGRRKGSERQTPFGAGLCRGAAGISLEGDVASSLSGP